MNEQTETAWFKTITINQVATLAGIVFISGGIYTKVLAGEEKSQENRKKIEGIERDIGAIKTDVEVTKNEVKNLSVKLDDFMRKQDAELDRFLHERETEQQEILRLLRHRQ